jgi:hypothetical protein
MARNGRTETLSVRFNPIKCFESGRVAAAFSRLFSVSEQSTQLPALRLQADCAVPPLLLMHSLPLLGLP